jgi:hypothetical protein
MKAKNITLRHAFHLLCLTHVSIEAFSPASVRTTSVTRIPHSSLVLARPPSIISTRTCRRRQRHREHTSTCLKLSPSASLSWVYMSILALQFGVQPILTKKFTPTTITRSTVVMAQDMVKFLTAAIFLWASGGWTASLQGMLVRVLSFI